MRSAPERTTLGRNMGHTEKPDMESFLKEWKADASVGDPTSLVRDYYLLLDELRVKRHDPDDPEGASRLGTLARFAMLLADFESIALRRAHHSKKRRVGNLHFRLFNYLQYYASSAYEGHPGEIGYERNAVTISTVHQAKGLEWSVVFVPCLTSSRFPSSKVGSARNWLTVFESL